MLSQLSSEFIAMRPNWNFRKIMWNYYHHHHYTYTARCGDHLLRLGFATKTAQERRPKRVAVINENVVIWAFSAHTLECQCDELAVVAGLDQPLTMRVLVDRGEESIIDRKERLKDHIRAKFYQIIPLLIRKSSNHNISGFYWIFWRLWITILTLTDWHKKYVHIATQIYR